MERISLSNTAFEGDNNIYLFDDGPETVLVDTGDGGEATREQLRTELSKHGVVFADVDRVLLTHWHHDHVGLAGVIQDESEATVHVHAADAGLVAGETGSWAELRDRMEQFLDIWGMPPEKRATLSEHMDTAESVDRFPDVVPFEDGERFSVGDYELTAVHVSGHTAGLCCFEQPNGEGSEIVSGDALLPVYTPNVGGADVRVERPLEKYLRGLDMIATADYGRAWPGHRDPIEDPSARATAIIDHHEQRAWRVLDAVRRLQPCDTWSVSEDLFGALQGIHVLHGPGESHAHLEHLERRGTVVRDGSAYRIGDGVAERLETLPSERWPLEY